MGRRGARRGWGGGRGAVAGEGGTGMYFLMCRMWGWLVPVVVAVSRGGLWDNLGGRSGVGGGAAPAAAGWCAVYVNDAFSPGAIAGRLLVGMSIGLVTTAAPLLLAEAAPKKLRGAHSILPHMAVVKGVAFMYAVTLTPLEVK